MRLLNLDDVLALERRAAAEPHPPPLHQRDDHPRAEVSGFGIYRGDGDWDSAPAGAAEPGEAFLCGQPRRDLSLYEEDHAAQSFDEPPREPAGRDRAAGDRAARAQSHQPDAGNWLSRKSIPHASVLSGARSFSARSRRMRFQVSSRSGNAPFDCALHPSASLRMQVSAQGAGCRLKWKLL